MSSISLSPTTGKIIAIAFAALLVLGIWFSIKRTNGYANGVQLEKPLQVEATVNSESAQSISVSGRTTIPAKVSLDVGAWPYAGWKDTNADGSFTFNDVIVPLGLTNLKIKAKASAGWKRFEGETQKSVWLTATPGAKAPGATYQAITVDSSKLPKVINRKVTANVSYRNLVLTLNATLDENDQRVQIVKSGSGPLENRVRHFINQVFKNFTIENHPLYDFKWKSDDLPCANKWCTFQAVSEPYNTVFSHTLDQSWKVTPVSESPAQEADSFELRVNEYEIQHANPQPQTSETDVCIWGNQPSGDRTFKLEYGISGLSNLFRVLRSSPYDLAPAKFGAYIYALVNTLLVIPIVWIFWFLVNRRCGLDESLSPESKSLICLIAIPFFSPAYSLIQTVASNLTVAPGSQPNWLKRILLRLFDSSIFSTTNDLRLMIVAACLIALIVGIAILAVKFGIKLDRLRLWGIAISSGLLLATVLNVVLMVFLAAALKLLSPNWSGLTQVLATLFNTTVLLLLVISIVLGGESFISQRHLSKRYIALLGVAVIVLCYPATPFNFFDTALTPLPHRMVKAEVEEFFRLIQPLAPYLALLFLLPLLRAEVQPVIITIGWILFAAFLVGTTSKWIIIPVPFLLALWMYRRYVIKPDDRRDAFDAITSYVLENRKKLLVNARSTLETLRKLKKDWKEEKFPRTEYNQKRRNIETSNEITEVTIKGPNVGGAEAVSGIGPFADNWENGTWSLTRGLLVAAPLALFYLQQNFFALRASTSAHYALLYLTSDFALELAYWSVAAFFFGYFFKYLSGDSGLRKALRVVLVICICLAASERTINLENYVFHSAQLFYFFVVMGLWIDYKNFNDASEAGSTWEDFYDYENLSGLNPVYAVVKNAVIVMVSGPVAKILYLVVNVVGQQLPTIRGYLALHFGFWIGFLPGLG